MVFLSDVWLDQTKVNNEYLYIAESIIPATVNILLYYFIICCFKKVMEKLRILFAGYCEDPPICFVLMGDFLSGTTSSSTSSGHLRQLFKSLAEMIKDFPTLVEQTQFVFVPGPSDSGFCNVLPRYRHLQNYLQP